MCLPIHPSCSLPGLSTQVGVDELTGEPVYGTCSADQCNDLILTFYAGLRGTTIRYFYGEWNQYKDQSSNR